MLIQIGADTVIESTTVQGIEKSFTRSHYGYEESTIITLLIGGGIVRITTNTDFKDVAKALIGTPTD